jgi:signal transduction histidine kinase
VSTSAGLLSPLRARIRRFLFNTGLGFLALVSGSLLGVALTLRLSVRVQALPFWFLRFVIAVVLENLWVLVLLPVLCYGAARVIELRPLSTALGAALFGELFVLSLDFVRDGAGPWLEDGGLSLGAELGALAVGVALSHRAVTRGRAEAHQRQSLAQAKAASRKDEYDAFLREAERAGERIARREPAESQEPGNPAA